MAYFECFASSGGSGQATLTVIGTATFSGLTCTCTDGITTLTKTFPSTSPYDINFDIPNEGTWTVSVIYGGDTYTETVQISLEQTIDLGLFNYQTWLSEGGVTGTYTDLDAVLEDEEAVRRLFTVHKSVDYLKSRIIDANITKIINNDLCAKWINLRDYALDTLYSRTAIADIMDEADKYFYGEWCLMPQVPKMTSNTAPSGVASAHTSDTNGEAYRAFDSNNTQAWVSTTSDSNAWLQYTFPSAKVITYLEMCPYITNRGNSVKQFKVLASNDNFVTSDELYVSEVFENSTTVTYDFTIKVHFNDAHVAYTSYRIAVLSTYDTSNYKGIRELQFYAWQPKGNVPVMTSDTAPYGTAFASTTYSGTNNYGVFDGVFSNNNANKWASTAFPGSIGYQSTNPVCVKRFMLACGDNDRPKAFKLQGSNTGDSNDYTDIQSYSDFTFAADLTPYYFDVENNDDYYLYHRIYITQTDQSGRSYAQIVELQFYGRELSVSVPKMTSNTAPYGVVINQNVSSNIGWHVFDNTNGTNIQMNLPNGSRLGFDFGRSVLIKFATVINSNDSVGRTRSAKTYNFQSSDDGTTWEDASETKTNTNTTANALIFAGEINDSNKVGRYFAFHPTEGQSTAPNEIHLGQIRFYGLDYSEKEFETGTTKKWLYDHGVLLEEFNTSNGVVSNTFVKFDTYQIEMGTTANNVFDYIVAKNVSDLTSYNLMRVKSGNKDIRSTSDSHAGQFGVLSSVTPTSSSIVSGASILDVNMPNNHGLDISSVTTNNYPGVFSQDGSRTRTYTISEWWME